MKNIINIDAIQYASIATSYIDGCGVWLWLSSIPVDGFDNYNYQIMNSNSNEELEFNAILSYLDNLKTANQPTTCVVCINDVYLIELLKGNITKPLSKYKNLLKTIKSLKNKDIDVSFKLNDIEDPLYQKSFEIAISKLSKNNNKEVVMKTITTKENKMVVKYDHIIEWDDCPTHEEVEFTLCIKKNATQTVWVAYNHNNHKSLSGVINTPNSNYAEMVAVISAIKRVIADDCCGITTVIINYQTNGIVNYINGKWNPTYKYQKGYQQAFNNLKKTTDLTVIFNRCDRTSITYKKAISLALKKLGKLA